LVLQAAAEVAMAADAVVVLLQNSLVCEHN
jgi:hypothetical protein